MLQQNSTSSSLFACLFGLTQIMGLEVFHILKKCVQAEKHV